MGNINKATKGLYTLIFVFLLSYQSIGQVYHLGRHEMPFDYSSEDFKVIPNGNNGFLIVATKRIEQSSEYEVEFTHLNNNFEVDWVDSLRLSKIFFIRGWDFNGSKNYLLLQDRFDTDELKLVMVDPKSKTVIELDRRKLERIRVTDFAVIRNSAVIVGSIGDRPSAFIYDLESLSLKTLSQVYQNKSDIIELKVNTDGVTFNILSSIKDRKNDRTIKVNTFDFEGNLVRDYVLETKPDYHLINAVSSSIVDKEQVNVGLYRYKAFTSPSGYYINHIDKTGRQTMRYMPYGAFDTFFDHEGEQKANRLKNKSLDQFKANKNMRYNSEAIFWPIVETDDRLIVFAEFFSPWSGNGLKAVPMKRDVYSRSTYKAPQFNLNSTLTGFSFSHTFSIVLDKKGGLIGDFSSGLNEGLFGRFNEEHFGKLTSYGELSYTKDQAFYAYYYNKRFSVHNVLDEIQPIQVDLKLKNNSDQLRYENEEFGDFLHWNESKYLVYGIQHIRDADNPSNLRKVYFVNAVSIGPNFVADELDK